jgi:hypothetical protein
MRCLCRALCLLALIAAGTATALVELDAQSLAEALTSRPVVLVLYTNWCALPHDHSRCAADQPPRDACRCDLCSSYLPELERVSASFNGSGLLFAKADAGSETGVVVAKALSALSVPFLTLLRPDEWLEPAAKTGAPRAPRPAVRYSGALHEQPTAAWLAKQCVPELPREPLSSGPAPQDGTARQYACRCGRAQRGAVSRST